ncbi:4694_t:CDS:2, partial [Racocetra persica]
DSEDVINKLFDKIQLLDENLTDWVSFYQQKWVITSLNKNASQIDDYTWRIAPNNTNVAEAAHALSNQHGKDKERFTAINIHQQYNIPYQGRNKGPISRNLLSNKRK